MDFTDLGPAMSQSIIRDQATKAVDLTTALAARVTILENQMLVILNLVKAVSERLDIVQEQLFKHD